MGTFWKRSIYLLLPFAGYIDVRIGVLNQHSGRTEKNIIIRWFYVFSVRHGELIQNSFVPVAHGKIYPPTGTQGNRNDEIEKTLFSFSCFYGKEKKLFFFAFWIWMDESSRKNENIEKTYKSKWSKRSFSDATCMGKCCQLANYVFICMLAPAIHNKCVRKRKDKVYTLSWCHMKTGETINCVLGWAFLCNAFHCLFFQEAQWMPAHWNDRKLCM